MQWQEIKGISTTIPLKVGTIIVHYRVFHRRILFKLQKLYILSYHHDPLHNWINLNILISI